jgi:ArsR family transcriptional regulator
MNRPEKSAASAHLLNSGSKEVGVSSGLMRAIAHPLRIQILAVIDENGSACVFEIFQRLNLEQSIVSQQLRILRNAGLVSTQRGGKFINYSINYEKIGRIVEAVRECNSKAPEEVKTRKRIVKRPYMTAATLATSVMATPDK